MEPAMSRTDIIEQALTLEPIDRLLLVELLQESLDKPDPEIDRIWAEEARRRLQAYRDGRVTAIPMEEVFRDL
jgi:putative addiction module component (TIGR02574 family)